MELTTISATNKFKSDYVNLIAMGHTEGSALKTLDVDFIDFFELCAKDPDFRKNIDEARKQRAEIWVEKIMDSVQTKYELDEETGQQVEVRLSAAAVPAEKLKFEKLKFLAKADNPDRYGDNSKKATIDINLNDFKLLAPAEAIKVLNNDPFNKMVTIDAEVTETKSDEDLL